MKSDILNSITSSINIPYKEFCEEYIRLAELIIQFEQEQMEIIDKSEEDEITKIYMGEKTKLSYLGEEGIKKHFNIKRARIIKESIQNNRGVSEAYNILNKYVLHHSVEIEKLGLTIKIGETLKPIELIENYEIAVSSLNNFKAQEEHYSKK